jgi:hypothetical protein
MVAVQTVIDLAKGQVGVHEGYSNGHWNNIQPYSAQVPGLAWSNGYAWCDVFVCWVFYKAGLTDFPIAAYTGTSTAGWKARNRWSEYPAIGAQVMFGANGGNVHTGIVIGYDANTITTVEGNTNANGSPEGDGVYIKTHRRTDPYVYGYGYPVYDGGIQSADPAWQNQNPSGGSGAGGGVPSGNVPAPTPPPAYPSVSISRLNAAIAHDGPGAQGAKSYPNDVLPVERALNAEGLLAGNLVDGSAGTSSFGNGSAYQKWQLRLGYRGTRRGQAADGYPGPASLTNLGHKHGFNVVG